MPLFIPVPLLLYDYVQDFTHYSILLFSIYMLDMHDNLYARHA